MQKVEDAVERDEIILDVDDYDDRKSFKILYVALKIGILQKKF